MQLENDGETDNRRDGLDSRELSAPADVQEGVGRRRPTESGASTTGSRHETQNPPRASTDERVWLRLSSAAVLVDLTPSALRKKLARHAPPAGIARRWGGAVMIHKERFLRWLDRAA